MFEIPNKDGFQLTFANGLKLSVIFEFGSYSAGRDFPYGVSGQQSPTAEIAIFANGRFVTQSILGDLGDDVLGHQTVEEVADIIAKIKAMSIEEVNNLTGSMTASELMAESGF